MFSSVATGTLRACVWFAPAAHHRGCPSLLAARDPPSPAVASKDEKYRPHVLYTVESPPSPETGGFLNTFSASNRNDSTMALSDEVEGENQQWHAGHPRHPGHPGQRLNAYVTGHQVQETNTRIHPPVSLLFFPRFFFRVVFVSLWYLDTAPHQSTLAHADLESLGSSRPRRRWNEGTHSRT